MKERLLSWGRARGYVVAWGPGAVLRVVRDDIDRRIAIGEIDPAFASENFAFSYPTPAAADIVIAIAVPRPAHRVTFQLDTGPFETLLPPTYEHYRQTYQEVRDDLAANGLPGFRVDLLHVPLKTLAARLGLVRYGRNNLAYAPGLGSYMQLVGCLTDAPLPVDEGWEARQPMLLDECSRCNACRRRCPSSAITRERVLLHAERCLPAANERAGEWPAWVDASMHNALIGCLVCQRICPVNPELNIADSGVAFSADETRLLMAADEGNRGWEAVERKFEQLGQQHHQAVFARNLRALVRAPRPGGGGHPNAAAKNTSVVVRSS